MTFDPDDPRLTAFALGELDDAERSEVEALVRDHPEARKLVEEVRATAQILTERLRHEPSPGLAPEHHQAIEVKLARSLCRGARPGRSLTAGSSWGWSPPSRSP